MTQDKFVQDHDIATDIKGRRFQYEDQLQRGGNACQQCIE